MIEYVTCRNCGMVKEEYCEKYKINNQNANIVIYARIFATSLPNDVWPAIGHNKLRQSQCSVAISRNYSITRDG